MLPDNELSSVAVTADFIAPYDRTKEPLIDYEEGGVALNDATQGMRVRIWRAQYLDGDVVLDAPSVAPTVLFSLDGISELALAFDQNMTPAVAYALDEGTAALRWFDNTTTDFATLTLPTGSTALRLALDEHRATLTGDSDVILTYLRSGKLFFRAQRDRYETEYSLKSDIEAIYTLGRFGRNKQLRLQWELVPIVPID